MRNLVSKISLWGRLHAALSCSYRSQPAAVFFPLTLLFLLSPLPCQLAAETNELMTQSARALSRDRSIPSQPYGFLNTIIQPLYNAIKGEADSNVGGKLPHAKWRNYDDFNEFFWSPRCFDRLSWPPNQSAVFFIPPNKTGHEGGKTGFVEQRTILNMFRSFDRVWILLIFAFQLMFITAWKAEGSNPFTYLAGNRDTVALLLTCFITWAGINLFLALADMVMEWRLIRPSNMRFNVRLLLRLLVAIAWCIAFTALYLHLHSLPPLLLEPRAPSPRLPPPSSRKRSIVMWNARKAATYWSPTANTTTVSVMWNARKAATYWSPTANTTTVSVMWNARKAATYWSPTANTTTVSVMWNARKAATYWSPTANTTTVSVMWNARKAATYWSPTANTTTVSVMWNARKAATYWSPTANTTTVSVMWNARKAATYWSPTANTTTVSVMWNARKAATYWSPTANTTTVSVMWNARKAATYWSPTANTTTVSVMWNARKAATYWSPTANTTTVSVMWNARKAATYWSPTANTTTVSVMWNARKAATYWSPTANTTTVSVMWNARKAATYWSPTANTTTVSVMWNARKAATYWSPTANTTTVSVMWNARKAATYWSPTANTTTVSHLLVAHSQHDYGLVPHSSARLHDPAPALPPSPLHPILPALTPLSPSHSVMWNARKAATYWSPTANTTTVSVMWNARKAATYWSPTANTTTVSVMWNARKAATYWSPTANTTTVSVMWNARKAATYWSPTANTTTVSFLIAALVFMTPHLLFRPLLSTPTLPSLSQRDVECTQGSHLLVAHSQHDYGLVPHSSARLHDPAPALPPSPLHPILPALTPLSPSPSVMWNARKAATYWSPTANTTTVSVMWNARKAATYWSPTANTTTVSVMWNARKAATYWSPTANTTTVSVMWNARKAATYWSPTANTTTVSFLIAALVFMTPHLLFRPLLSTPILPALTPLSPSPSVMWNARKAATYWSPTANTTTVSFLIAALVFMTPHLLFRPLLSTPILPSLSQRDVECTQGSHLLVAHSQHDYGLVPHSSARLHDPAPALPPSPLHPHSALSLPAVMWNARKAATYWSPTANTTTVSVMWNARKAATYWSPTANTTTVSVMWNARKAATYWSPTANTTTVSFLIAALVFMTPHLLFRPPSPPPFCPLSPSVMWNARKAATYWSPTANTTTVSFLIAALVFMTPHLLFRPLLSTPILPSLSQRDVECTQGSHLLVAHSQHDYGLVPHSSARLHDPAPALPPSPLHPILPALTPLSPSPSVMWNARKAATYWSPTANTTTVSFLIAALVFMTPHLLFRPLLSTPILPSLSQRDVECTQGSHLLVAHSQHDYGLAATYWSPTANTTTVSFLIAALVFMTPHLLFRPLLSTPILPSLSQRDVECTQGSHLLVAHSQHDYGLVPHSSARLHDPAPALPPSPLHPHSALSLPAVMWNARKAATYWSPTANTTTVSFLIAALVFMTPHLLFRPLLSTPILPSLSQRDVECTQGSHLLVAHSQHDYGLAATYWSPTANTTTVSFLIAALVFMTPHLLFRPLLSTPILPSLSQRDVECTQGSHLLVAHSQHDYGLAATYWSPTANTTTVSFLIAALVFMTPHLLFRPLLSTPILPSLSQRDVECTQGSHLLVAHSQHDYGLVPHSSARLHDPAPALPPSPLHPHSALSLPAVMWNARKAATYWSPTANTTTVSFLIAALVFMTPHLLFRPLLSTPILPSLSQRDVECTQGSHLLVARSQHDYGLAATYWSPTANTTTVSFLIAALVFMTPHLLFRPLLSTPILPSLSQRDVECTQGSHLLVAHSQHDYGLVPHSSARLHDPAPALPPSPLHPHSALSLPAVMWNARKAATYWSPTANTTTVSFLIAALVFMTPHLLFRPLLSTPILPSLSQRDVECTQGSHLLVAHSQHDYGLVPHSSARLHDPAPALPPSPLHPHSALSLPAVMWNARKAATYWSPTANTTTVSFLIAALVFMTPHLLFRPLLSTPILPSLSQRDVECTQGSHLLVAHSQHDYGLVPHSSARLHDPAPALPPSPLHPHSALSLPAVMWNARKAATYWSPTANTTTVSFLIAALVFMTPHLLFRPLLSTPILPSLSQRDVECTQGSHLLVAHSQHDYGLVPHSSARLHDPAPALPPSPLHPHSALSLPAVMWNARKAATYWSPTANTTTVSFLIAALVFMTPHLLFRPLLSTPILPSLSQRDVECTQGSHLLVAHSQHDYGLVPHSSARLHDPAPALPPSPLHPHSALSLPAVMWNARKAATYWSPTANTTTVSFLIAALVFMTPHLLFRPLLSTPILPSLSQRDVECTQGSHLLVAHSQHDYGLVPHSSARLHDPAPALPPSPLHPHSALSLPAVMWNARKAATYWSPTANTTTVSFLIAALVFMTPHLLGILLFLTPEISRRVEASSSSFIRMLVTCLEDDNFVGRGMREDTWDSIKYSFFWLLLLAGKFAFSYFLLIRPMVEPTKALLNTTIHYTWPELYKSGNYVAVFWLWAPVGVIYIMDLSIFYAIFSSVVGYIMGVFAHIGEVSHVKLLTLRFRFLPRAMHLNLLPPSTNAQRSGGMRSAMARMWNRMAMTYGLVSPDTWETDERWAVLWNSVIGSFREEDLLSDAELNLLSIPEAYTTATVSRWPIVLLADQVVKATTIAGRWKNSSSSLWRRLCSSDFCRCAVLETFALFRLLLSHLLIAGTPEHRMVQQLLAEIDGAASGASGEAQTDRDFVDDFNLGKLPAVQAKLVALTAFLLRGPTEDELPKAIMLVQNLHEVAVRDFWSAGNYSLLLSKGVIPRSIPPASPLYVGAIRLPDPSDPTYFAPLQRLHSLLTCHNAMATIPANPEARRRVTFFCNSLFMAMPPAPTVQRMRSFCVMTPYYNESVMYSPDELRRPNEDGISLLYYLQNIFPDEWKNLEERLGVRGREVWEFDDGAEVCRWASYRGQTLARTVRGIMYYHRALDLLSCFDTDPDAPPTEGRELHSKRQPTAAAPPVEEMSAAAAAAAAVASAFGGSGRMPDAGWDSQASVEHIREQISQHLGQQREYDPQFSLADVKFTYVVACQIYGEHKRKNDPKARHVLELMQENPALRIAYVDEQPPAPGSGGGTRYYSVLVKWDQWNQREVEIFRVQLPGPIKIGEGKPENQNHAIIFTRGEALQTIDMNQDSYLEEALKIRNFLEEFSESRRRILGMREHVFTGSVSSLAAFMSAQETAFVTIGQRVLYNPLKVRMHYGHPDVFDRVWSLARGGISKASRVINISEDIFAGFNTTLRRGAISHHEYIQVGKGRDVGLNQISLFEAKVASGNGEQLLSRDVYRLGHGLDIFRLLSFYTTSIGFFFSTALTAMAVYAFLWGRCYLVLSGVEATVSSSDNQALSTAINQQFLVQIGLFTSLPMLMELILEKGTGAAIWEFLLMHVQLCFAFFTFSLGTRAHYFLRTLMHGGAKYRATGRGFVVKHEPFAENYRLYSRSHFNKAVELLLCLVIYMLYSSLRASTAYWLLSLSAWILVLSWLLAPFAFNPLGFDWLKCCDDWEEWTAWLWAKGGKGVTEKQAWVAWWDEERAHLKTTGWGGWLVETLLALRWFFFQYALVYRLDMASASTSILVYVYSWLFIFAMGLFWISLTLCDLYLSIRAHRLHRAVKTTICLVFLAAFITALSFTSLSFSDLFLLPLVFLPTGWGFLQLTLVVAGAFPAVETWWTWGLVKSFARTYEFIIGVIVFLPMAVLSWLPGVQDMQTKILGHPDEFMPLLRIRHMAKMVSKLPDDEDFAFCYGMLNRVSRSFAFVIQQLHPLLRDPVCIFYLVLRALDTVEDDMAVPIDEKVPILIAFHQHICDPDWKFVCGTKDYKDLMQRLHHVRHALEKLEPRYKAVILDITRRMGAGMASFITTEVETVPQYDEYCHYVAGLVGIGLSDLFHAANLEEAFEESLSNSMGLFLQKTNIIRDYLEDINEEPAPRMFWPKAIWGKYAARLEDFKEVDSNGAAAVKCVNELVTNALGHVSDCLTYMHRLRDPQVFRFCAIPQIMAMGTLALCYNNIGVFEGVVKMRKGLAAKVMEQTWSMADVRSSFTDFGFEILKKVQPALPLAITASYKWRGWAKAKRMAYFSPLHLLAIAHVVPLRTTSHPHTHPNERQVDDSDPNSQATRECIGKIIASCRTEGRLVRGRLSVCDNAKWRYLFYLFLIVSVLSFLPSLD
ncbi:unnamed protein product [Closterium sp. Naga37s-1]|nr:unnamed protein product [Closterium sp. Naga37s-1]